MSAPSPSPSPSPSPTPTPTLQPSPAPSATSSATPSSTLSVRVIGIGLLGPGLVDWTQGSAVLRDPQTWQPQPTVVPPPQRLPATERRRAGTVVKASVVVADQALADAPGIDPSRLATVFTSSTGDPLNCHLLCEALAAPQRLMSPTRFTNSVHNAAAGYWHIATQSSAPSTSLAAFDASFHAGLLEAAVQCRHSAKPVLLVACDVPYPEPLHAVRPLLDVFAVALLLAPLAPLAPLEPSPQGRILVLQPGADATALRCGHPGLDALCVGIPAAQSLPLLMALAQMEQGQVFNLKLPTPQMERGQVFNF